MNRAAEATPARPSSPPDTASDWLTRHLADTAAHRLLLADEVARIFGTKKSSIYAAAREGRIGGVVRFGRQVRFDPVRLADWIANGGEALAGGWRRS